MIRINVAIAFGLVLLASATGYLAGAQPQSDSELPFVDPVVDVTVLPDYSPTQNASSGRNYELAHEQFLNALKLFSQNVDEDRKLEAETAQLAAQYGRADNEDDRRKLAADIRVLVEKQFAMRQARRLEELRRLQAELRRLEQIHQRREQQRDAIIDIRVEQLLRDADGLGWGGPDRDRYLNFRSAVDAGVNNAFGDNSFEPSPDELRDAMEAHKQAIIKATGQNPFGARSNPVIQAHQHAIIELQKAQAEQAERAHEAARRAEETARRAGASARRAAEAERARRAERTGDLFFDSDEVDAASEDEQ
jgi:hypothetical protein